MKILLTNENITELCQGNANKIQEVNNILKAQEPTELENYSSVGQLYHNTDLGYAMLLALNEILDGYFGVEGSAEYGYSYINTGDIYTDTVCLMNDTIFWCSWGSLQEALEDQALKNIEIFEQTDKAILAEWNEHYQTDSYEPGWYYWLCFSGCMPESDPIGPFGTQEEAHRDAIEWNIDSVDIEDIITSISK